MNSGSSNDISVTFLLLISFLCPEVNTATRRQAIVEALDTPKSCLNGGKNVVSVDENKDVIIIGREENRRYADCKIIVGLDPKLEEKGARLVIYFESMYIHDCGVQLQLNESDNSDLEASGVNYEIYKSECFMKNPMTIYTRPNYFIVIRLMKEKKAQLNFNIRLNITKAESVPSAGPAVHVVVIVSFVVAVVVLGALYLLIKYLGRLGDNWREQRSEEAMTRAINIYNSSSAEPHVSRTNGEADLVYMEPGNQDRVRSSTRGPEIAFVHPDGTLERFRTTSTEGQHNRSRTTEDHVSMTHSHLHPVGGGSPPAHLHKVTPPSGPAVSRLAQDSGDHVMLTPTTPQKNAKIAAEKKKKSNKKKDDTEVGLDVPPSYEEALAMPGPLVTEEGDGDMDSLLDCEGATAVHGRLALDYMNLRPGDTGEEMQQRLLSDEGGAVGGTDDHADHIMMAPSARSLNS